MSRRVTTEDKQAKAAAEATTHGGLVALAGGPAIGWFWRDDWERCRKTKRFVGYVETGERIENRAIKDPNGIDLRWYGPGTVWRFDPSLAPPEPPSSQIDPIPPAYCACGERLLLPRVGRETCERCRLGVTTPALVWRPRGVVTAEVPEWFVEPAPDLAEPVELESAPEPASQPQEPPPASAVEIAGFVWRCVAYLYDR
jgi:hypothetical protein